MQLKNGKANTNRAIRGAIVHAKRSATVYSVQISTGTCQLSQHKIEAMALAYPNNSRG